MTAFHMNITETAKQYIQSLLEKNPGKLFRLSIKKTGCSGFAYWPHWVENPEATDLSYAIADHLHIAVDQAWLAWLDGLTVDYLEEQKAGLKQKRLVFKSPKEASRCGCGESFTT
jgi:iron-sulfur cluster assembly accessory protein